MNQTYPLRLLQNAWQQTLGGSGQILLFADAGGKRLGTLVKEFDTQVDARRFHYRLGPDASALGYYPLVDVLQWLYDQSDVTDCAQWLADIGAYPPNRPTWRQLLDDHYFQRPALRLKDYVVQHMHSLEDDLVRMLADLTRTRPVLVAIANFHFASPSLFRLLNRTRQSLPARLLILTASDPDLLPGHGHDFQGLQPTPADELEEPPWLIDLPPNQAAIDLDWPETRKNESLGIPQLIQLALENHAQLCHQETLSLCDQINLILDERQIVPVADHRYELMIIEAEALFYSERFNAAITSLNELLELAREDRNHNRLFDAYLRLAWCSLHKHRLDNAEQMSTHARTALENIEEKDARWLLREREWLLLQALIHGQQHRRLPIAHQHRLEALLPLENNDDYVYAFRFAQVNWESSLDEREKHFLRKALLGGLRLARRGDNQVATIKLLQGMSVLQANERRHQRALTCLRLAQRIAIPLHSPELEVPLLNAVGYIRVQRGELEEARGTFHQALLSLQMTANYNQIVVTLNHLAWTYFVGGNLSECQRLLNAAVRLCRIRGFHVLPYHTLDDLLLHQALCRFYLGHSVLAQQTLLEMNHRAPELSNRGRILYACLKLHFARSEADYTVIDQLQNELRELLDQAPDLPVQMASMAAYAAGPGRLEPPPDTPGIDWMARAQTNPEVLPALAVDVLSLLRSAELEGELEHLQQRVRDTRLLSHLSAQANAATDAAELIETVCRQLSAHLDCDYTAIDLGEQPFMSPIFEYRGLSRSMAVKLRDQLALQKLTRGRLLVSVRSLDLPGLDSGYVSVNRISLPHHDFGDLVLMTRSNKGFEESVLRTSSMLAGQLAAAIQRLTHERELQHLSSTDMLTGLINRQALYPRLEEELARVRRHDTYAFCLAFLDLDNFKYLNDHFGHNLGDQVLRGFARVLRDHTRTEDIAARLGGDEFVILFPGQSGREVQKLSQRLLEQFATPEQCNTFLHQHTGQWLQISPENCLGCSVGIVELNSKRIPKSVDHLLNLADHAMYEAKSQGKNRAIVSRASPAKAPRAKDE